MKGAGNSKDLTAADNLRRVVESSSVFGQSPKKGLSKISSNGTGNCVWEPRPHYGAVMHVPSYVDA